jgi:hypothetical protein
MTFQYQETDEEGDGGWIFVHFQGPGNSVSQVMSCWCIYCTNFDVYKILSVFACFICDPPTQNQAEVAENWIWHFNTIGKPHFCSLQWAIVHSCMWFSFKVMSFFAGGVSIWSFWENISRSHLPTSAWFWDGGSHFEYFLGQEQVSAERKMLAKYMFSTQFFHCVFATF